MTFHSYFKSWLCLVIFCLVLFPSDDSRGDTGKDVTLSEARKLKDETYVELQNQYRTIANLFRALGTRATGFDVLREELTEEDGTVTPISARKLHEEVMTMLENIEKTKSEIAAADKFTEAHCNALTTFNNSIRAKVNETDEFIKGQEKLLARELESFEKLSRELASDIKKSSSGERAVSD